MYISEICRYFCWKDVRSFCIAKGSFIFFRQKYQCSWLLSRKTLNELTYKRTRLANDAWNNLAQVFKWWLRYLLKLCILDAWELYSKYIHCFRLDQPGRVAQSVGHLTWKSVVLVWQHTFVSPSAFSRRAVVSYWRKYLHEVLVNRLEGLSLPRKSVVRLTVRPDMTLDVYRGRKTTMQQQQQQQSFKSLRNWYSRISNGQTTLKNVILASMQCCYFESSSMWLI